MAARSKSGLASWLGNISLFLTISLIGLYLLDLFVVTTQPVVDAYRYVPEIGYGLRPNHSFRLFTREYDIPITVTDRGMRGPGPDESRPCRLLMLGDSFVFGQGLADDETVPARLQTMLERRWPGRWAVFNAGVNGYDTRQEAALYDQVADDIHPDAVVVSFVLNDVLSNSGEYHFSPIAEGWLRYLPFHNIATALAYMIRNPRELLFKIGLPVHYAEPQHMSCLIEKGCTRGWQATVEQMERIGARARQSAALLTIVNIPLLSQMTGDYPGLDDWLPSRIFTPLAPQIAATFIDFRTAPGLGREDYFPIDQHLNAQGAERLAETIFTAPRLLPESCGTGR